MYFEGAQGRAAEAERAIQRLTKTKGRVTQTMQGGGEKDERTGRAEAAADGKMLEWLNKVKTALANGDQSAKKMRLIAGAVKEKTVAAVRAATGIDVSGFSHMIDGSAVQHIEERHGTNGSHDSSMQNSEDMARALYVLENFDNCVWEKSGGKKRTSRQFRDGNNNPAPVLRFSKKVNGTYYVVEAVPDSADKKMHIVSAYMQKNGGSVTQELNMGYPPQHTSETPLGPVASTDDSVAQNTAEVKTAENGAESAQKPARATGGEMTRAEETEAQRDALEEERSRFYTYLLSGGTKAALNENLGRMKGDALQRAEQYIVEALNNGDIIEENGVYRRSDARVQAEQRFEREKELRQSGIHGDTGWMSRKDAAHLEQLARTGGVSVEIVDTLGDAQGTYDPRTGRIQIARDATDPVGFVIQHELTHRMKQSSPEKWSEFLGYVQKHYGESWEGTVEDYCRRYAETTST